MSNISETERQEILQKHKTVARAVAADDAPAARVIYDAFKSQGKSFSEDEISALGFLWLTKKKRGGDRSPDMVDFLHELGFDFKQYVPNAGTRSASGNHLPFLLLEDADGDAILERGLDIGAIPLTVRDNRGETLLMDVLDFGNFELADRLVKRGLSVDLKNIAGHTALHLFASKVNFRAVHWLIQNGADPDMEDLQFVRPSQLVPETVGDGWDTDAMFNALEDYVDDFKASKPFVGNPEFFKMLAREESEAAEAKAKAEAASAPKRAPSP